jgi:hypothetical protein
LRGSSNKGDLAIEDGQGGDQSSVDKHATSVYWTHISSM